MFSKAVGWIHVQDALLRQRYIYSWFGIHTVLRGMMQTGYRCNYKSLEFHRCRGASIFSGFAPMLYAAPWWLYSKFCFFRSFYHRVGVATPSRSCPLSETAWGVGFSSRCRLQSVPTLLFLAAASSPAVRAQTHAVVVLWALSRYKPFKRDPPISGSVLDKLKVNDLTCIASRRHR